ncbi:MAG: Arc family DNA-binding protein [Wenzhouxiangella sp.]|jgi:plasmid stability protein|nr:Arc family DNA-binding protein [Wenzhouxiangella sp.]
MPNLLIKQVPQSVVEALRERARRNHRSLQGELLALVTQSTIATAERRDDGLAEEADGVTIEVIASELRRRYPQPSAEGPSSTEIIRAERDAR